MKTFPGASSQNTPRFRKKHQCKRMPAEVHQFAHDLFNQLTVINLCSFNLHLAVRDIVGPAITNDLQTLDRVVEDAMRLAERSSQAIAASGSLTAQNTTAGQVTASS
jgi:hypothetical protein